MTDVTLDDRGRLKLPRELRERFGDHFEVVELHDGIKLVPVADDPLAALRDEFAHVDGSAEELREGARETALDLLDVDDEALLSELERETSADRSEVLRRLVRAGLDDWREERALDRLRDSDVTVRKATEIAGVEYVEMLTMASEAGIDVGYATGDLERDLDRI